MSVFEPTTSRVSLRMCVLYRSATALIYLDLSIAKFHGLSQILGLLRGCSHREVNYSPARQLILPNEKMAVCDETRDTFGQNVEAEP